MTGCDQGSLGSLGMSTCGKVPRSIGKSMGSLSGQVPRVRVPKSMGSRVRVTMVMVPRQ